MIFSSYEYVEMNLADVKTYGPRPAQLKMIIEGVITDTKIR